MEKQSPFLAYDARNNHYFIDWRVTTSVIANDILLRRLLKTQPYMRGALLDVGCGKRPYRLLYGEQTNPSFGTEVTFSPHGTMAADLLCFAEALPFADESFDTILCTEVLEHTRQPFDVFREFARLLRPHGHLIISVPFIYPIHEPPHDYWRFTIHGLRELCASTGLEVVNTYNKQGIVTLLVVLAAIFSMRMTNLISQLLHSSIPLRERPWVRWLLALPQYGYLWLLNQTQNRFAIDDDSAWLTVGYVIVAKRLPDPLTNAEA